MTNARASAITALCATLTCGLAATLGESTDARPVELDSLTRLHAGRPMRASSSDANWQSGNRDSRPIKPNETLIMADVDGPGVITHIWLTINASDLRVGRTLVMRMYWDGQDEPAVESPLGDFFAVGHGVRRYVDSLPVSVTSDGRAFNCYWAMPFAKHAKVTLSNDSMDYKVGVYWYVDYEKLPALPPDTAYFHAQYRQEFPAKQDQNYLILDAQGSGHYVGTVLSVYMRSKGWFGEGDDFFYIDGEAEPSLRGTGTEDYFCDAWAFREFNRPYYGVVMFDGFEVGDRVSVYRWHIKDPIRFAKSLKVEIEHKGGMTDEQGKTVSYFHDRPDLFSSVAFWYQTGKAKQYTKLSPLAERVPPATTVEFEKCLEASKPSPADARMKAVQSNMFSASQFLLTRFTNEKTTMIVPFTLKSNAGGIARLYLATSPESGIWSFALDDKIIGAEVDLYSPTQGIREIRVGMVELDAGEHTLKMECKGRNHASLSYHVGLDALMVEELTAYSVPATNPAPTK
jgi:hypothetical protein